MWSSGGGDGGRRGKARRRRRRPPDPPTATPAPHPGATGLVGARLTSRLTAAGRPVRVLTRDVARARGKLNTPRTTFHAPSEWADALAGAGGVVNLAGEPIATRWSEPLKREIRRSRVDGTRTLVATIAALPDAVRPPVLVSASAVGFYGTSETQSFSEASPPGTDFLARLCADWEAEAFAARSAGLRVAVVRTGIVLAREGGALAKMLPVFSAFAGGPLGSGAQWCSWIHADDLVSLYVAALSDPAFDGPFNGTAPSPARMADLCAALGSAMGRPSWLPVPSVALTVRRGEGRRVVGAAREGGAAAAGRAPTLGAPSAMQAMLGGGASVVLEGQRVLPTASAAAGFRHAHSALGPAVRHVLR